MKELSLWGTTSGSTSCKTFYVRSGYLLGWGGGGTVGGTLLRNTSATLQNCRKPWGKYDGVFRAHSRIFLWRSEVIELLKSCRAVIDET